MTTSDTSTTAAGSGRESGNTMSETTEGRTVSDVLRRKFPAEEVGKLPRVTCPDCSDRRKTCSEHRKSRCTTCQAYVSERHIHIDYVGHADVTARLLEADPEWNWEPKAEDERGMPVFDTDDNGSPVGLWIKLTVGGVTRLGYGSVPGGQPDAVKVLIGDALRNAAMRFGVALDLWAKGDRADPTAENATASAGRRSNGNGRSNGQTVRPESGPAPSGSAELDPDAQPYADEAFEARTLAALKEIHTRARDAHKIAALVKDPATMRVGGLGQYIGFRKRQLEDVADGLAKLNDVARVRRIDIGEVETQLKLITGKTIEDATPDEMRSAAAKMLEEVPA